MDAATRRAWRALGAAELLGRAVLLPFLVSRAALLAAAWLGSQLAPSWTYFDPVGAVRGWSRVPVAALDVWGRYDTSWYLDLAMHGYRPTANLAAEQSNLAFFPLYASLIRAGSALLPRSWQGETGHYLVALAIANLCAVGGLSAVFLTVKDAWSDERVARRTVLYMLAYPAGFFLSCAYSESLFLLLSALTFLLAGRGRFGWAAAFAFLLGLTRPTGVLIAPALAIVAWQARRGELPAGGIPSTAAPGAAMASLAVLAAPAGLGVHALHLALRTGIPDAAFRAQAAWGRTFTAPWRTLLHPSAWHEKMGTIELACVALFLVLGTGLVVRRRYALGTYALLSLAPILLSGTLMSATRLLLVVFPAFALLAEGGARDRVDRPVLVVFSTVQAALFIAWSRFYWVA